ncbi:methyl-accepting chemotaxis protein [Vibrio sp. SCSIO 43137]|uniref:methyl-accepting chemotaxis protein n=1 Tax=Vibrio sp. SCSIO 43137 TaxID=3021011 RepID=UPI0023070A27|nr:methyl-accepting chemotaxis protein [Vibrio sp. SCSIO 43137]WCE28590.1 methyl-accepting chemotaxis protein [Vibrio sp. SCSIO 43137]
MDNFQLSQKQKIYLVLAILTIGFIGLSVYTAGRLNEMSQEYNTSIDVTNGSTEIEATQVKLLQLANGLSAMNAEKVSQINSALSSILQSTQSNQNYLNRIGLSQSANKLKLAFSDYQNALQPWLSLKARLGFNADDGLLGQLKTLALDIEAKIKETGMVTLDSDFQAMIKQQQNYLLTPNENNLKLFNRARAGFTNMSNTYAMLDLYEKELQQYGETFEQVAALSQQSDVLEADLSQKQSAVLSIIAQISSQLGDISRSHQESATAKADGTLWSVMIASLLLAVVTIGVFITLSFSISRSLAQTANALSAIASGNLANRLPVSNNHQDEFNQLAIAINETCENLGQLVNDVQLNSEALSNDAEELNQGIDNVVESQSDVVNQTQLLATATEEVSSTAQQVSDNLERVAAVSRSSTESANTGEKVISLAIESIEEVSEILASTSVHTTQLEEASNRIDSVMEMINGIAEQTNLLALNAAIEAARAGDQGRGFAVVADEVRSLAVRTVEAVAEISGTVDTLKNESAEVIQYISKSESSMIKGRERGSDAVEALTEITRKTSEASEQTEVIFRSIRELAETSQSMADSMSKISSSMSLIEESNHSLKQTSQLVDQRSTKLNNKCLTFSV